VAPWDKFSCGLQCPWGAVVYHSVPKRTADGEIVPMTDEDYETEKACSLRRNYLRGSGKVWRGSPDG